MKILKLTLVTAVIINIAACSSPEDNARAVIAEYCDAFRDNDSDALNELSVVKELTSFPFWSDESREEASCGEKVKKLSEDSYVFQLKDTMDEYAIGIPIKVGLVDGEFKITGVNGL